MSTDRDTKQSFLSELKRRNVYRVSLAYIIVAWLTLQILDVVIPLIGAPEWVPQLFLFVIAIGLPIAIIFSWVYELTPDGVKRQAEVDLSQSITGETGRRLDAVIIGIFIMSIAFLLVDRIIFSRDEPTPAVGTESTNSETIAAGTLDADDETDADDASIAVLPFANMSSDESSGHFSDGLADTLLHMLAQVSGLRVAARTSSFQFRDNNQDIGSIARQLNVASVLEGSVQKAGDQIRVTAQLIDAESGFHLWSGTYDRSFDDIFAIQDEIAGEVVAALKISLLGEEQARMQQHATDDVDAYTEYLLGIQDIAENSFESLEDSVVHLQKAVEIDPNYALAYAALGRAWLSLGEIGARQNDEVLPFAGEALDNALSLDPKLPGAISLKAAIAYIRGDREDLEPRFKEALALGPNDITAHESYATFLNYENRSEEALEVIRDALQRDPLSINLLITSSRALQGLQRYDEALDVLARIREIYPQSPNGYYRSGFVEFERGNWAQAIMWFVQSLEADPDDPELPVQIGDYYLDLFLYDEAARWYEKGVEIDPRQPMADSSRLVKPMIDRDYDTTLSMARELLIKGIDDRNGSRQLALEVIARYGDRTGDYSEFLNWAEQFYPGMFASPPDGVAQNRQLAARLAYVLRVSGRQEPGDALAEAAIASQRANDEQYGVRSTTLYVAAATGDQEMLDTALAEIASKPLSNSSWDMHFGAPVFMQALREREEYKEIIAARRKHAVQQREILLELNGGSYP